MGRALESGVSAGAATGLGLAKVSPGFRFWGYTPRCVSKSGESVDSEWVADWTKSRVWKLLRTLELRRLVIRRTRGLGRRGED